ncbi:type II secretion system F family protein [Roseiterribacter gracilis]|uniref:Type II secretion system protein n=1 Tax=Roseiterribacter gracilis TaxID=2812848 RepID=A0A8S8XCR0_9PROT|nr:type II secretion system protein [Rhodospirillales bacterium TMPK1]
MSGDFAYEATDEQGRVVRGRLEAASLRSAQRALRRQGLSPLAIDPVTTTSRTSRRTRATRQDLVLLLDELATLLGAGVALSEALQAVQRGERPATLAASLEELSRAVRRGENFADSLRRCVPGLPAYVHALAQAGETVGTLAASLADAAKQMRYDLKLRQDFAQALLYPAILAAAGIAAVLFVFVAVVPRFAALLDNRQVALPWLSRIVIATGLFVQANLVWLLLVALLVAVALTAWLRPPERRAALLDHLRGVPVIGSWLIDADAARWSTLVATLLGAKLRLMPALALARAGVALPSSARNLDAVERAVRGGRALADALAAHTDLSAAAINLVRVGERSGELARMLANYADMATRNADARRKRALALVEPAAILAIGGIVGLVVAAIMLAVTSISAGAV